jgi:two-component system response regulator MprA
VRVLIVDDDPGVRIALARALEVDGYLVTQAEDGAQALAALAGARADAVVLDVAMPGMSGLEVCARLRDTGNEVAVLMLTARDEIDDRVAGLDAGADDYLVKPYALRELKARLRALLRRRDVPDQTLAFANLRIEALSRDAYRGDRRLVLSRTEYNLLELFLLHPRQVLPRATIFERVWGYDFGPSSNLIGVYMGYLRRKTEQDGEARLLHTVRGVGYILRDD